MYQSLSESLDQNVWPLEEQNVWLLRGQPILLTASGPVSNRDGSVYFSVCQNHWGSCLTARSRALSSKNWFNRLGEEPGICSINKLPGRFLLQVVGVSKLLSTTIVLVHYPSFAPRMVVISIVSRFIEFNIWNQGGWLLSMLKKNQSNMITREMNLNEWMFSKQKNFTSLPCIWRYIH